jgi:protein-S-isoprenylcysteine O-methyltransferase Ste14
MSDQAPEHPDVIAFPPLILAVTVLLGLALQWLMPLHILAATDRTWRLAVGSLLLAGVFLLLIGTRSLIRNGTNVSPFEPTTVLVTEGVFRLSRNPLYTGGMLAMLGFACLLNLDWLVILAIPNALLLHYGVVKREEAYLAEKFGEAYRRYEAAVPRYLWPL